MTNYFKFLFQEVLFSDRALSKQQQRFVSRIIVLEKELNQEHQRLIALCNKLTANPEEFPAREASLAQDQKKLQQKIETMTSGIKELLSLELTELDRDLSEPTKVLEHLFPILEGYLTYLQNEGVLQSKKEQDEFLALVEEIKGLVEKIYNHIERSLLEIKEVYEQMLVKGNVFALNRESISTLMTVDLQWVTRKAAVSQHIRTLLKKVKELEDKIGNEIAQKKKYQTFGKLYSLLEEQKELIKTANSQLGREEERWLVLQDKYKNQRVQYERVRNFALPASVKRTIEGKLKAAVRLEAEIVSEISRLNIPVQVTAKAEQLTSAEKKAVLAEFNLLRCAPNSSGVLPLVFWLGENRALGYLQANDSKNLNYLKQLLSQGLISKDGGMLSQRQAAIQNLSKLGAIRSPHQAFLNYLKEYRQQLEELVKFVEERVELKRRLLGHIGAELYKLNALVKEVEEKVSNVAKAFVAREQKKVVSLTNAREQARLKAELKKAEDVATEATIQREKDLNVITQEERDTVARVATLFTLTQKQGGRMEALTGKLKQHSLGLFLLLFGATAVGIAAGQAANAYGQGASLPSAPKPHYQIVNIGRDAGKIVYQMQAKYDETHRTVEHSLKVDGYFAFARFGDFTSGGDVEKEIGEIANTLGTVAASEGYSSLADFASRGNLKIEYSVEGEACNVGPSAKNLEIYSLRRAQLGDQFVRKLFTGFPDSSFKSSVRGKGEPGPEIVINQVVINSVSDMSLIKSLSGKGQAVLAKLRNSFVQEAKKNPSSAFEHLVLGLHKNAELDQIFLAPHRNVKITMFVTYNTKEGKVVWEKVPIFVPGPHYTTLAFKKDPAPWKSDKAILPPGFALGGPTWKEIALTEQRFKGRAGFQTPFRGVGGGVRGRHQGPTGGWG